MRLAAPMCYVPLQLSTCNLQRSLHLEGHSLRVTARCLFAHLLRQSAWLTYDEVAHLMMPCHGLNRNWGIHSQPNEPKSQSAFTCSWVWVPFQSGTKLALLSPGFVCLFVALSEIAFKLL